MNKRNLLLLLVFLFCGGQLHGQNLATKHWVFFSDKGPEILSNSPASFKAVLKNLSERALARRAKVAAEDMLVDSRDLPVYSQYLAGIETAGGEITVVSRWLNACSAFLTTQQITEIEKLPFVLKVEPVRVMASPPEVRHSAAPLPKIRNIQATETKFDYGASIDQITQLNVHRVHNADIFGRNVLMGFLDSGFNYKTHAAFSSLEVVDEYDFIYGDGTTANETGDGPSQHNHGTQVLSVAAGFAPGNLIGPAFLARFLLAKTENVSSETRSEEDNWVAAIEWMEARGVEVASTSLGYYDVFDDPAENYSWSDLDGNTAVTTIAAQIATEKGVVVVCSAGNEGSRDWRYISPPADARDVITVGGLDKSGSRSSFSSIGPSFYSRTKPDVMALGRSVSMVEPNSKSFTINNGTSFSAPLIAGIVAQMLSVHPNLTPQDVTEALHNTASNANNPDSLLGWGTVDAVRAITYWGPAFGHIFHVEILDEGGAKLSVGFLGGPEMDTTSIKINWKLENSGQFTTMPMEPVGLAQYQSPIINFSEIENIEFYLTVETLAKDIYFYPDTAAIELFKLDYSGRVNGYSEAQLLPHNRTETHYLFHPFPNPFIPAQNENVRFAFDLTSEAAVDLILYNVRGQKIAVVLNNRRLPSGPGFSDWSGLDARGKRVATGVYFLVAKFRQMDGKEVIKKRKLLLLN
ncbi:MAG: hypothetical protein DWQ05_15565 [Calditrichaeota bacterium]|nr:MAG: hypothetical protein DWQ05_15565 [Calditrichota bacterium]